MAGNGGGNNSSNSNPPSSSSPASHHHNHQAPKILLAKPALVTAAKYNRGPSGTGADDSPASIRSRVSSVGFLNLLSESWDLHTDRFLPFLTDNTDFTVIGVIGPPGVGKSTIMNEIYGFDPSSSGMLPPFSIESLETKAMAKHCTVGIEPRITSERIILLDSQPVFSPSVLAEMIRPDGLSTVSIFGGGEPLPAEMAHELMSIQLGVLLSSICHIILVVSEGVHDNNMWRLMATVDLLKHNIPDPSSLSLSHPQSSNLGSDKDIKDKIQEVGEEYMATPVFVHTKLHEQDMAPHYIVQVNKALNQYFRSSSFNKQKQPNASKENTLVSESTDSDSDPAPLKSFFIPSKSNADYPGTQYESFHSSLWKLRDQVLSMSGPSFSRTVSERDWLKNTGKIWELVKNSSTISDYCRTLQNSGLFRR
ncbi:uncharacterized protein [Rutidosis leptorrhynchoides]|uniref:uncharacterized protein n=1 Tax=Rutidosis leptorrhynchoides TaxID=125765 RepID=UPI003A99A153